MLKLLLIPLILYAAIVAAFYFGQTSLIFPARMVEGAGALPAGAERLAIRTSDNNSLHGVHLRPRGPANGPVILAFPGNAWNAEHAALFLSETYAGADVVAFHYRGYAPSTGKPSAAALLADSLLIHDEVARLFPGRPVIAVGFSIGTGVAAHLASRRPIAGAILVTPFDSLAAVGSGHYPWLPVRPLLRHQMNPAAELRNSSVPVALIVAGRDTLIPPVRAAALGEAAGNLAYVRTLREAGHNDIYQHPAFRPVMYEARRTLLEEKPSR